MECVISPLHNTLHKGACVKNLVFPGQLPDIYPLSYLPFRILHNVLYLKHHSVTIRVWLGERKRLLYKRSPFYTHPYWSIWTIITKKGIKRRRDNLKSLDVDSSVYLVVMNE